MIAQPLSSLSFHASDRDFSVNNKHLLAPLAFIALAVSASTLHAEVDEKPKTSINLKFDGATDEPEWTAQNDSVMGGISKGGAAIREGSLHFTGSLSLENNGGFAQVRIRNLRYDLSTSKTIKLKVKGDGRTYQLRFATDARHRGSPISYSVEFKTNADQWDEITLDLTDLKPSHHGESLDGPPADLSKIEEMSLLIGDKLEGAFSLEVDWIKSVD